MGITEREFLNKMIALAKAGEDEMEHLKKRLKAESGCTARR